MDLTGIPGDFEQRTYRTFGDRGLAWYRTIPELVSECIDQWELTDCEAFGDLSINLIVLAVSVVHGQVVLKIGVPHTDLYTEMEALRLFRDAPVCRCFDIDRKRGAMLLERIVPGNDLFSVRDRSRQIEVFADLMGRLHRSANGNEQLPEFSDWTSKAFARARTEGKATSRFLGLVDSAEDAVMDLKRRGGDAMVLHGDLHHMNILKNDRDGWTIIDPKGVIGPSIFEVGRFLQNHLDQFPDKKRTDAFDDAVECLASVSGFARHDIASATLVDCMLGRCWGLEDNLTEAEQAQCLREAIVSGTRYREAMKRWA